MSIQSCCEGVRNFCDATGQAFIGLMKKGSELRGDEAIFKRTSRIAACAIELLNAVAPAYMRPLGRLTQITKAVILHDFWAILQYPRAYFRPINAEMIDAKAVQTALIDEMKKINDSEGNTVTAEDVITAIPEDVITATAKDVITAQLQSMSVPYHTVNEFIDRLQTRLQNHSLKDDSKPFNDIDLSALKTSDGTEKRFVKQKPMLERWTNATWALADVLTVVWCSSDLWKIVETAKYAETIGQYRGFQWVKEQKLEQCLIGVVCVGFALKLVEAVRSLNYDTLNEEEQTLKTMNARAAMIDLAFYGAIFGCMIGRVNISPIAINLLGIAANSFGIWNIMNRPKHDFFG